MRRKIVSIEQIAQAHSATPAQIALGWLLKRSPKMIPIPGTSSIVHLEENVAASGIEISQEEFETLNTRAG